MNPPFSQNPAPSAPLHDAEQGAKDAHWMALALDVARQAAARGEVPVGAVVVKDGVLVASGHNQPMSASDPTAHAEVVALRAAAKAMGNYRLPDCTLYVTLEPCLMCCGALINARVARVVYGAAEPKTGAAGSVLNAFALQSLNHHTRVQGGVLAEACAAELQRFFKTRRTKQPYPLRDDALRTPVDRFRGLAELPFESRYVSDLPSLQGLRMHYLDEGPKGGVGEAGTTNGTVTWLALHPIADWCHRFAPLVLELVRQGHRVLAPDLVGFGMSDKPKKAAHHSRDWHVQVLREWLRHVQAQDLALLMESDDHGLGHALQRLEPSLFVPPHRVPLRPIVPPDTTEAQAAPFPDDGHRAGPKALAKWTEPQA